jgi:hypothetical protein
MWGDAMNNSWYEHSGNQSNNKTKHKKRFFLTPSFEGSTFVLISKVWACFVTSFGCR